ncbi:MAG: hypothetical protein ACSW8H_08000, partial [bacterium]
VERMNTLRSSLSMAKLEPYKMRKRRDGSVASKVTAEEKVAFDQYFEQLLALANEMSYVRFDLTKIDDYLDELIRMVVQAKREGCSAKAIQRCLAGIAFGLREARAELPLHMDAEEVRVLRENHMAAWVQICTQTILLDRIQTERDRMEEEKKIAEERYKEAVEDTDAFIKDHPSAWLKIREMTDDERTRLTGDERKLSSKQKLAVNRQLDVQRKGQKIGELEDNLVTVESNVSVLLDTLESWEKAVAAYDVKEINRLTEEFKIKTVEQQRNMAKLREMTDRINALFDELYSSREQKQDIIATNDRYEEMINERNMQAAQDAAGRKLYEQEMLARKQEAERLAQEQADNMLENEPEEEQYNF